MDRMITTVINGEERPLNYSIAVMFDMTEKFGNIRNAMDIISKDSMEGFETVRWFAVKMANDAELCRRDAGYDHLPMLKNEDITPRMRPLDYEMLKGAVADAITLGYVRELKKEDEETDLGLEELDAKKA